VIEVSTLIIVLVVLLLIVGFIASPTIFLFVLGIITWNPVILLIAIFLMLCGSR